MEYFKGDARAANDPDLMVDFDRSFQNQNKNALHGEKSQPTDQERLCNQYYFMHFVDKSLLIERHKYLQGEITKQTFGMFVSRVRAEIVPYFKDYKIDEIRTQHIAEFISILQRKSIKAITIKQYLGLLKRILFIALEDEVIFKIPMFPKLKTKSIPRGGFSLNEYKLLYQTSSEMAEDSSSLDEMNYKYTANGAFIKRSSVPLEMKWLIRFMVNSFIRPVDIKLIQHKHVEVISGKNTYLRLNLPETKRHAGQVVTMQAAKCVYENIKKYQINRGYGDDNDFIFLPEVKDRNGAIQLITSHFKKILDKANLRRGQYGQFRTFYSLRHTAITFRLLYGGGIDLLTLARNARTSVEMIEKFYSSNLMPEMNIALLQSKRTRIS